MGAFGEEAERAVVQHMVEPELGFRLDAFGTGLADVARAPHPAQAVAPGQVFQQRHAAHQLGVARAVGAASVLVPRAGSYSRVMAGRPISVLVLNARQPRARVQATLSASRPKSGLDLALQ
ncbi:MAG: hypothetical protein JNK55_22770 [Rubrivivax sp.]|nr:hypothetical protein [Rubrivivax sp.]